MAQISGRVVERGTDTPIAGANVYAGLDGMKEPPREPLPSATSDAEGRFQLSGLPPGRYQVEAQKMGYAPSMGMTLARLVDATQNDSIENIILELARGGSVSGHVLDASGRAMEGIQVMALLKRLKIATTSIASDPVGTPMLMPMGGGTTTSTGEFEIAGLPAGEYLVAARPEEEGRRDRRVSTSSDVLVPTYYPAATEPAGARSIEVDDNQKIGDVAISLVAVPAFRVSGVVVDSAGGQVPHAGIMMRAKAAPGQVPDPMTEFSFRTGQTDEAGRFSIEGVTPGAYELTVMTGGSGIGSVFHDTYYAVDVRDGIPRSVPVPDEFVAPPEPGAVAVTVLASDVANVKLTTAPGGW